MSGLNKMGDQQQEPPSSDEELQERIIGELRTIYDPEIPVNIYDLGLIYTLDVQPSGEVYIRMTLTAPNCPVAQDFPGIIQNALLNVPGVSNVNVELVWEPLWSRDNMSEAALLQLGLL